jgi:hypothetical protein
MSKAHGSVAVHIEQALMGLEVAVDQVTPLLDGRTRHQYPDLPVAQLLDQSVHARSRREIRAMNDDLDAIPVAKLPRALLEPWRAPGDEHEVHASSSELLGDGAADARRGAASERMVAGYVDRIQRAIVNALDNARRRGELDPDVEIEDQARLLTTSLLGFWLLMRAGVEAELLRGAARAWRVQLDRLRVVVACEVAGKPK